jgi:hypothetical protein
MADGRHDDDHAWLLARERGEPAPPLSEDRAGRYAQLGTLIADLPAMPPGLIDREGWEQDVLAAIDAKSDAAASPPAGQSAPSAPRRRRTAAVAAAALAMAASIAIVLFARRSAVDPGLDGHGSSTPPLDVTRGMHIVAGRLAFDHAIQVTRSNIATCR